METVRRYLGLGGELDSAGGNTIPVLVVALILLATYNVLDRPWWQETLVATAGIFLAGVVIGLLPRKASRASPKLERN